MGECRGAHAGSVAAAVLRRVARRYGRQHDGPTGNDKKNKPAGDVIVPVRERCRYG